MATRALHKTEAQPEPRRRPFIKRLLFEPPQFEPMRRLMDKMTHGTPSLTPKDIRDLKKLLLEIHPEERGRAVELDVFAALSRVVVGARVSLLRKVAEEERDSIPWSFRESIIPPARAKEY